MPDSPPTVLITGCSSGFGLETSLELAKRGWRVFASMRRLDRRADLVAAARAAGVTVEVLELDVCSTTSIESAVAELFSRTGGRLDAVIHNAGVGDAGFFEDVDESVLRTVMETNFFGVCALTRAVLPSMRSRRAGRILAVSSVAAFVGQPTITAYTASKRALEGWAESLAVEVRPFGVSVAVVQPGTSRTSIWANSHIEVVEGSPYEAAARRMSDQVGSMVERFAMDPRKVAVRLADLAEGRRTGFRNPLGPDARLVWRPAGWLPYRLRFRMLGRLSGVTPALSGARANQDRGSGE